jgi:hypothetical protein
MTFRIKPIDLNQTKSVLKIPPHATVTVNPDFISFKTSTLTYELWQTDGGYMLEEWYGESCQPVKTTHFNKTTGVTAGYLTSVLIVDGILL